MIIQKIVKDDVFEIIYYLKDIDINIDIYADRRTEYNSATIDIYTPLKFTFNTKYNRNDRELIYGAIVPIDIDPMSTFISKSLREYYPLIIELSYMMADLFIKEFNDYIGGIKK